MKHILKSLCAVTAAGLLVGCASRGAGAGGTANYHCTLTGKDMAECCCTKKDGKLYCNETQKFLEKCCCTGMEHKM